MKDTKDFEDLNNKEIYTEILLGVLRYVRLDKTSNDIDYKKEIIKKLKFNNIDDDYHLRSYIDLLEDTEMAIMNVYKHGLCKTENLMDDNAEMYLRLYGVLNAVYQQLGAIIGLVKLCDSTNQKSIIESLMNLRIIELRNKAAAHTANFLLENKELTSYKLVQCYLSKWGENITLVTNTDNGIFKYDLFFELNIFNEKVENILFNICNKLLGKRWIKNYSGENYKWLNNRFIFASNRKYVYKSNKEDEYNKYRELNLEFISNDEIARKFLETIENFNSSEYFKNEIEKINKKIQS